MQTVPGARLEINRIPVIIHRMLYHPRSSADVFYLQPNGNNGFPINSKDINYLNSIRTVIYPRDIIITKLLGRLKRNLFIWEKNCFKNLPESKIEHSIEFQFAFNLLTCARNPASRIHNKSIGCQL